MRYFFCGSFLLVMLHDGVSCAVLSVPCSLMVTCWERTDLLAVVYDVFCLFPKCFLVHIRIKGEVVAVKLVSALQKKYLMTVPRQHFFCGYFMFFSVLCLLCICACLFISALWSPAGKGLTSWLSFVVSNCEFVTFPLVFGVRCGT